MDEEKDKGGAQIGNKNAEIYTEDEMVRLFNLMLEYLCTPKQVSIGKTIVKRRNYETKEIEDDSNTEKVVTYKPTTILSAVLHIGKTRLWLVQMNKKFKGNKLVSNLYSMVKAQAEANVIEAAEARIIDARMAQLNLVNNYDWITANTKNEDKVEVNTVLRNVEFEDDDS